MIAQVRHVNCTVHMHTFKKRISIDFNGLSIHNNHLALRIKNSKMKCNTQLWIEKISDKFPQKRKPNIRNTINRVDSIFKVLE